MKYLMGIDIGTQGTKAALFDQQLKLVSESFKPSRLINPAPGVVWQEADDIYESVLLSIRSLIDTSGMDASDILAVGIDSQMAGIMGIDDDFNPVTYYDSWLDTRCEKYLNEMNKKAGDRIIEVTGCPVTYTHGPKILWWKYEHPDAYKKIAKFVLPHVFVVGKMTGLRAKEAYFDYTCIQYSGFGDNKNLVWSDELLFMFDIDLSKMARIASPFEIVGTVTGEAASLCGLKKGTPLVAGAGDTAASIFGSGLFDDDKLLDCAGTASVLCSTVTSYKPDVLFRTLTMMRSPVEKTWFPLAYINGGGLCLDWFKNEMTGKPPATFHQLEEKAKLISPGSDGILFIPHFAGRALPNNPHLKGSFIGLDWKHTREHLFRAIMESIAYEYAYYLHVLKKLYPDSHFTQLIATGGGAKSELFLQIKADVLGVDVISYETGDTSLIGSAAIAGHGIGAVPDYRRLIGNTIKIRKKIKPDLINHQRYKLYTETYLDTIDALTPVYKSNLYRNNGEA